MSGESVEVPTRDAIANWTSDQRAEVASILAEFVSPPKTRMDRARRLTVLLVTCGGAAALIPWIIYLNTTLPNSLSGGAWRTAWVGFDIGIVVVLACAGWMALHRRQLIMPLLAIATTLFIVDAWFDVTLSWGTSEHLVSLVTAGALELPVAGILIAAILMLHRRAVTTVASLRGRRNSTFSLWRAPVIMLGSPSVKHRPLQSDTPDHPA